ncbi:LON peptidase substrate-binding domain-containing protein [Salinimicrobium terrae]|uniref:LON peptidase substrate-binding domain-containing protein n=1 Tax=Salinimicrobium terrae TaxID=470866 RepID=UPI00040105A5|nr:LON peptidase substrate-binding domain-containing protein [Salinimicrobium terrae]
MVSRLALFPLKSVVYPGENLPLHIFERRYIQLIEDCQSTGIHFGIPFYINNRLEFGTEMKLLKIVRNYDSGAKDILSQGLRVFRIRRFEQNEPGKFYAGGDVEFVINRDDSTRTLKNQLLDLIFELYVHLEVPRPLIDKNSFNSYTLAHKIGLSQEQEYDLLKLTSEKKRQEYLINHLLITIPIVQEMNRTKQVIELNGHFRNFDPLDFREFRLKTKK